LPIQIAERSPQSTGSDTAGGSVAAPMENNKEPPTG